VVGDGVVIFSSDGQRCSKNDIPDSPLRAFRKSDGSIVALSTHYENRRLLGPTLMELHHDCTVVYQGSDNSDPAGFDNKTWVASTWTNDGRTIAALGHNEYHADRFPGRCRFKSEAECWYNAIVLLQSSNGGETFKRATPEPVAAPPLQEAASQGRSVGYFNPSNIVSDKGYYFVLVNQSGIGPEKSGGRCLFRTSDPALLSNWSFFDGHNFVASAGSPYDGGRPHPPCQAARGFHGVLGSIARLRGTDLFVGFTIDDGAVEAVFSHDLLNWSGNQAVMRSSSYWSKTCDGGHRYNYVSVLDNESPGRNFDSIGGEASLFIVRAGCNVTMSRDLVRYQVKIGDYPTTR
jgi:hypothetical protein